MSEVNDGNSEMLHKVASMLCTIYTAKDVRETIYSSPTAEEDADIIMDFMLGKIKEKVLELTLNVN